MGADDGCGAGTVNTFLREDSAESLDKIIDILRACSAFDGQFLQMDVIEVVEH